MPQAADVVYSKNTVRVTFRTFTWDDLQASAAALSASLLKVEGSSIVVIPTLQGVTPGMLGFVEVTAGQYELRVDTRALSPGEYRVVFEGEMGGDHFYEPVAFQVKTLATELIRR